SQFSTPYAFTRTAERLLERARELAGRDRDADLDALQGEVTARQQALEAARAQRRNEAIDQMLATVASVRAAAAESAGTDFARRAANRENLDAIQRELLEIERLLNEVRTDWEQNAYNNLNGRLGVQGRLRERVLPLLDRRSGFLRPSIRKQAESEAVFGRLVSGLENLTGELRGFDDYVMLDAVRPSAVPLAPGEIPTTIDVTEEVGAPVTAAAAPTAEERAAGPRRELEKLRNAYRRSWWGTMVFAMIAPILIVAALATTTGVEVAPVRKAPEAPKAPVPAVVQPAAKVAPKAEEKKKEVAPYSKQYLSYRIQLQTPTAFEKQVQAKVAASQAEAAKMDAAEAKLKTVEGRIDTAGAELGKVHEELKGVQGKAGQEAREQELKTQAKALQTEITGLIGQLDQARISYYQLLGDPFAVSPSDVELQAPVDVFARKARLLKGMLEELRRAPAGHETEIRTLEEQVTVAQNLVKSLETKRDQVTKLRDNARGLLEEAMVGPITSWREVGGLRPEEDWQKYLSFSITIQGHTLTAKEYLGRYRYPKTADGTGLTEPGYALRIRLGVDPRTGEFKWVPVAQYGQRSVPGGVIERFKNPLTPYYYRDEADGTFVVRYSKGPVLFDTKTKRIAGYLSGQQLPSKVGLDTKIEPDGKRSQNFPLILPVTAQLEELTPEQYRARMGWDEKTRKLVGALAIFEGSEMLKQPDIAPSVKAGHYYMLSYGVDATTTRGGENYLLVPGGPIQVGYVNRQGNVVRGNFSLSRYSVRLGTDYTFSNQYLAPGTHQMAQQYDDLLFQGGAIVVKGGVRGTGQYAPGADILPSKGAYSGALSAIRQEKLEIVREITEKGATPALLARLDNLENLIILRQQGGYFNNLVGRPGAIPAQYEVAGAVTDYYLRIGVSFDMLSQLLDQPAVGIQAQAPPQILEPVSARQTALVTDTATGAKDTPEHVAPAKGVPTRAPDRELIAPDKVYVAMLEADAAGKHREQGKETWARTWLRENNLEGRFGQIMVLDAGGAPLFYLSGNVKINGVPLEQVDFSKTPLTAADKIEAGYVTRVLRDPATGYATGSITSTLKPGAFTYSTFNPDRADLFPVGVDVRQTVNLGKAPGTSLDLFEVRTYARDSKGLLLLKEGQAQYTAHYEYRFPNTRLFASVYGDARLDIRDGRVAGVLKSPSGREAVGEVEIVKDRKTSEIFPFDTAKGPALPAQPSATFENQPQKAQFEGATYDVMVRRSKATGQVEKIFAVSDAVGERLRYFSDVSGRMEALDLTTGNIYAVNPGTYNAGALVATTEVAGTVTANGKTYEIRIRRANNAAKTIERVMAVDLRGNEAVRYFQKTGGAWEAEVVETGAIHAVNAADYSLGAQIATIQATGRTVAVAGTEYDIKVRRSMDGQVEQVLGFDKIGREAVRYFPDADGKLAEAEHVATGDIYAVTDAATYAVGEKIARTERPGNVTLGGSSYSLRVRKDLAGSVQRVFALDSFGKEALRYFLDPDGRAVEAEDAATGNIYTVGADYALGAQVGTTRNLPGRLQFDGKAYDVKVQANLDGTVRRAFAIDRMGREVGSFFSRPQTVDGNPVAGLFVIDRGQTAAQALPAGVSAANGYKGTEPARTIYYAGADYSLLPDLGVKGYAVKTEASVRFEDKSWFITEELDSKGRFVIGRALDAGGIDRAAVTLMPEGVYQVEIIARDVKDIAPDAKQQLIRTGYLAKKEGTSFVVERDVIRTSYVSTFPVTLAADGTPQGLDRLILDTVDIPALRRPMAQQKLDQALRSIALNLGLKGQVTLIKTEVAMSNGSKSFFYRVKEDPFARILIFRSSDVEANVVINTEWDQSSGRKGFEFSPLGQVYLQEAGAPTVTSDQVIARYGLEKLRGELKNRGVNFPAEAFSEVTRSLLVDGDENQKSPMDVRFLLPNDPNARDFLRVSRGSARFILWSLDARVPFGVAAGEVVAIGGDVNIILRQTEFVAWNQAGKEYVYRMKTEYRDGREYTDPDVLVGFNYGTGIVWEHYVHEEWKLYSKDGFPLFIHRIQQADGPVTAPFSSRPYQGIDGKSYGLHGHELRHSSFVTKTWTHPQTGDIYTLTTEKFETQTPFYGPTFFLVKNGDLAAVIEGEGANRQVHIDPYGDTFRQRGYNSLLFLGGRTVFTALGGEPIEAIADRISVEGKEVPVQALNESERQELPVYFNPMKYAMSHWWIIALMLAGGAASTIGAAKILRRLRAPSETVAPEKKDIEALDRVFQDMATEASDRVFEEMGEGQGPAEGARLASQALQTVLGKETRSLDADDVLYLLSGRSPELYVTLVLFSDRFPTQPFPDRPLYVAIRRGVPVVPTLGERLRQLVFSTPARHEYDEFQVTYDREQERIVVQRSRVSSRLNELGLPLREDRGTVSLPVGAAELARFKEILPMRNLIAGETGYGQGARLALSLAERLVTTKQLGANLVIGPNVPESEREGRILSHFKNNLGYTDAEARKIVEADRRSRTGFGGFLTRLGLRAPLVSFDDAEQDITRYPQSQPLTAAAAPADLENAARLKYPQALVIRELLTGGLIDEADLRAAVTESSAGNARGDLLWRRAQTVLVNLAQNRVLANGLQADQVERLPDTPESNLLKYVFRNNVYPPAEIRALAAGQTNLGRFVERLVVERVVRPQMTAVMAGTYQGLMSASAEADVLRNVTAEILPAVQNDPSLLLQLRDTGEMVYHPFPVGKSVEAMTLREHILLKSLQRSPSETNNHSIGQFSAIWPYALYVVRRVDRMLKDNRPKNEVIQLIDDLNASFPPAVKRELGRYKTMTTREAWKTDEEVGLAAIGKAIAGRARPRATVLGEIETALQGRPNVDNVLREIDRRLTAGETDAQILTGIRPLLDFSERFKLVDLFSELDMWDLFEYVQRQADEAVARGDAPLSVEEQIARVTGKPLRTLAQLRAAATGTSSDAKSEVASDFKKTTLALAAVYNPEAARADVETKRPAVFRKAPFLLGLGIAAIGAGAAFLGLLAAPVTMPLIAGGLILAFATQRPGGTGLAALYFGRIFAPFFSLEKFWGMGPAQKAGFFATAALFVAGGAALILLAPKLLTLGILLILLAPALLPIVFSNMPLKEKLFWGGIVMGASTAYVGGLLLFLLFGGAILATVLSYGFVFTALLVALTYPVTIISFYHVATTIRSYLVLQREVWSKTANSVVGLGSFNPFRGLFGMLRSNRVPAEERTSNFMKMAIPLYLLGLFVTSSAAALTAFGILSLGVLAVGTGTFTLAFLAVAIPLYVLYRYLPRVDTAEYWENTFGRWFAEVQDVEVNHRSPIPNGESATEYMERVINVLNRRYLLSDDEARLWTDAVNGRPGGRFVRPRSQKAFEVLRLTFFTLSQKKVAPDVWALLQASSTHVQAAGELFTHTAENSIPMGTFNNGSSLLGYVARNQPVEWANLIARLGQSTNPRIAAAAPLLAAINERTDVVELLNTSPLSPGERQTVYAEIVRWLNEMRPNNDAVMDSMAQDFLEYHMTLAYQSGDLAYRRAVRAVGQEHASLAEAFSALSSRAPASLNPDEAIFVARYASYQERVDLKLRGIFQDAALWGNFRGQTGGTNLTQISPVENLVTTLTGYRDNLPAGDPVRAEVEHFIAELGAFDPRGKAGNPRFATIEQWSEDFLAWRQANFDRWMFLIRKMQQATDAALVPTGPGEQRPKDFMNTLVQSAETVLKGRRANLTVAFHDAAQDNFLSNAPGKHQGIALNLKSFFGTTVDFDAHVMNEHGQQIFRPVWASMNSRLRNPQLAAINPMMNVWASSTWAFPATWFYSIAQVVWTSDVQRAIRGKALDYGKYMGIPQTIGPFMPPGEDSEGLLMLQRSASRPGVFYTGTQIDWFSYRWGRPSLFSESLVTTEMRYAFNVTRFMMDRGSFAVFHNPNVPTQVKLTHIFLWFHYFIAPFALTLLVLLPALSPFSAFAFLKPLLFFVGTSYILMEAINLNNLNRHWRESGSFWQALHLMLRDAILALPFYVFLIPFFFRGIWLASLEMFSFLRTVKEAFLSSWNERQRFEELMLFKLFGPRGVPFNSLVGIAGLAAWTVGLVFMTPLAPIILLPYLLASIAFMTGMYVIDAFEHGPRQAGLLYGYSFWAMFTRVPSVISRTITHLRSGSVSYVQRAKDRATAAGLRPNELGDVRPLTVDELIRGRRDALARAEAVKARLHLTEDLAPKTTNELKVWTASREVDEQVAAGTRYSLAAARLAAPVQGARLAALTAEEQAAIIRDYEPFMQGQNNRNTRRLLEAHLASGDYEWVRTNMEIKFGERSRGLLARFTFPRSAIGRQLRAAIDRLPAENLPEAAARRAEVESIVNYARTHAADVAGIRDRLTRFYAAVNRLVAEGVFQRYYAQQLKAQSYRAVTDASLQPLVDRFVFEHDVIPRIEGARLTGARLAEVAEGERRALEKLTDAYLNGQLGGLSAARIRQFAGEFPEIGILL
ncbi:MAG TPA: hypothetical protein VL404_09820, partial [Candidatus Eisenbacteria bacterium]|nr:hypothetical protein [Candidatus Eisenbacteria bacterium]